MTYDVVVAGGSFAGLVLATSIRGRVALVEKGQVGDGQTSACATTLDLIHKLGLEASIEEIHEHAVMHTRTGTVRFRLPYRFASFDYRRFCELLMERFDGELVNEAALGVEDGAVVTATRRVEGRVLVDATGWRATLASSVQPGFPVATMRSYGLEKPALGFGGSGLHFYFDPGIRGDGYGWAFPAGGVARSGVLSYVAAAGVRASTEDFLAAEGMHGGHYHGGYLPAGLRPALAGEVFLVGDAAGHCLPLTGEGIRPAVFFAQQLSELLNAVISGDLELDSARGAYSTLQRRYERRYRWLRQAQALLNGWPDPPIGLFFQAFSKGVLYRWLCGVYWEVAAPILPAARPNPARLEATA